MTLRRAALFLALSLPWILAPRPAVAQDSSAGKPLLSTLSGAYTEQQAGRGEKIFSTICLSCHATGDYTGEEFKTKYVGGTAFDVFEVIRSSMPQDAPGSLTRQQYADVVAYLFKLNNLPAGATELSTEKDSLKLVKVEIKDTTRTR